MVSFWWCWWWRRGVMASCHHVEWFAGRSTMVMVVISFPIFQDLCGVMFVFSNTLSYLTLSLLLCNSTLHPKLLKTVHFTCVRNTCSLFYLFYLFYLLPLVAVLSCFSLSSLCRSRIAQTEQVWPAFSWGFKSLVQSTWLITGNSNVILQGYM